MTATLRTARIDITPTRPVPLAGYRQRTGDFSEIASELEINAALLEAGETHLLLLTADVIWLSDAVARHIRTRAQELLGLPPSAVLLSASHTHFAPGLDPSKPRLGQVDPDYVTHFETAATELLQQLKRQPARPVEMIAGRSQAPLAIHRRRWKWRFKDRRLRRIVEIAPNPDGPVDHTVHTLDLRDAETGSSLAVIWNYACHPVCDPNRTAVSSEFPGAVRTALREQTGQPALPVLFLQGFAGDVRPDFQGYRRGLGRKTGIGKRLKHVAEAAINRTPEFRLPTPDEHAQWCDQLCGHVRAALAAAGSPLKVDRISNLTTSVPIADLQSPDNQSVAMDVALHCLGDDLAFVALSAEPVTPYGDVIRACLPQRTVFNVGYCNQVFGYLPTKTMIQDGGYEVERFVPVFGLQGTLAERVESDVANAMRQLADRARSTHKT